MAFLNSDFLPSFSFFSLSTLRSKCWQLPVTFDEAAAAQPFPIAMLATADGVQHTKNRSSIPAMTIYSLERSPQKLRGMLSRYCLEVRAGLFVGRLDSRMRELLWEKVERISIKLLAKKGKMIEKNGI